MPSRWLAMKPKAAIRIGADFQAAVPGPAVAAEPAPAASPAATPAAVAAGAAREGPSELARKRPAGDTAGA